MKVVWVSSWNRICGIADYSKVLWPKIEAELFKKGWESELVSLDEYPPAEELTERLVELKPDIIHFQHEYGLFGGKTPGSYSFPAIIEALRRQLPNTKIIMTAHSVIAADYRYPLQGKPVWEKPLRWAANFLLLPRLRRLWREETWGVADVVITHTQSLKNDLRSAGARQVEVIPHFVLPVESGWGRRSDPARTKRILVFGFFTPDKGQDLAIEILAALKGMAPGISVKLVLGGGVRGKPDEVYHQECLALIKKRGLENDVEVTGYVREDQMNALFERSELVLLPFRWTSGSGSLSQALGRGATILTSDLPLFREVLETEPHALQMFKTGDVEDAAQKINQILQNAEWNELLRQGAKRYTQTYTPEKVAGSHVAVYERMAR